MRRHLPPIALFFLPFLLYFDLLGGEKIRGYFDLVRYAYPDRFYGMGQLADGVIPLWNPYLLCGLPYLANWQSALLYPLNLPFLFLPFPAAYNVFGLLHMGLAALGAYLLCRELGRGQGPASVAGLVYGFSAYPQLVLNYPSHISAYSWLPFLLLLGGRAARRRVYILPLLLVGALQLYAGYPHTLFYSSALLILYLVLSAGIRRAVVVAVPFVGGLALVGAAQLLPFLEFASSARRLGDWQFAYSMPSRFLATLFWPFILGQPGWPGYRGELAFSLYELYCGVLAIPLALVAVLALLGLLFRSRKRVVADRTKGRFFVWLFPFVLLFLFGTNTPLGKALLCLPGSGIFEFAKAVPVLVICLALSAAWGLELLAGAVARRRRKAFMVAGVALFLLDFTALRLKQDIVPHPYKNIGPRSAFSALEGKEAGRLLCLRPAMEQGRGFSWARNSGDAARAMVETLQPNTNLVAGHAALNGFLSLTPASFEPIKRYYQRAYPYDRGDLFQRANLHYIVIPSRLAGERYEEVSAGAGFRLYRCRQRRGRAYLSEDAAGRRPLARGEVRYLAPGPGRRELEFSAPGDAFLFGSEDLVVGWRAVLDGRRVELKRAEPCFYSLAVSRGKHYLEMVYRPGSFLVGLFVSLLSVLALCAVAAGVAMVRRYSPSLVLRRWLKNTAVHERRRTSDPTSLYELRRAGERRKEFLTAKALRIIIRVP